jgi:hypothetical protein
MLLSADLAGIRGMHRCRPAETVAPELRQDRPGNIRTVVKADHQRTIGSAIQESHAVSCTLQTSSSPTKTFPSLLAVGWYSSHADSPSKKGPERFQIPPFEAAIADRCQRWQSAPQVQSNCLNIAP